jgi:hypothetical protein
MGRKAINREGQLKKLIHIKQEHKSILKKIAKNKKLSPKGYIESLIDKAYSEYNNQEEE